MLYKQVPVDEETPVQYAAVYITHWKQHWGEPECLFVEERGHKEDLESKLQSALAEIAIMDVSSLPDHDIKHYLSAIAYITGAIRLLQESQ